MKNYIFSIAIMIGLLHAGISEAQTTVYCVLNGVASHCPGAIEPATVTGVITEQQPTGNSDVRQSTSVPYDMNAMRSGYNNTPTTAPTTVNGEMYGTDGRDAAARRKAYSGSVNPANASATGAVAVVYPNPVLAGTRIVLNTLTKSPVAVDVIDLNGIMLRSYDFAAGIYNLDVDMSGIPAGIYSVRVYGRDVPMQNLKLVKQ